MWSREPSLSKRWIPALALSGLVALSGCGGGNTEPEAQAVESPPVPVETQTLEKRSIPLAVEAMGSVHPWVSVSPGTKIMGRIDRVSVRQGDRVRKGQVLATLEQRDLMAAVEQARAAVTLAEANLENSQAQYERMTGLHGRGSVTDKGLEDATSSFRVSEALLAQARAGLAAAEVTLGYAEIVSPISGWLTEKRVEAGDMASAGTPMFVVEDTSRVKVVVKMPESDVVGLAAGAPVRVRVDVLDRDWEATVDRVLPAGDPMSRTFQVELVLSNADGQLKSGMFARAFLDRGSREALVVPRSAIVARGQLEGVFVIDEQQTAHLRWVRLGPSREGHVEVISGLRGGERIVSSPPTGFSDGTTVETR